MTRTSARGYLARSGIALALTLGAIAMALLAIAVVVAPPPALSFLGLSTRAELLVNLARWPAMVLWLAVGLTVLYRIASPGQTPTWRCVVPGALGAALLSLPASIALSQYTANFSSFGRLKVRWLPLPSCRSGSSSATTSLLGAETSSETQRQARS